MMKKDGLEFESQSFLIGRFYRRLEFCMFMILCGLREL